jgi:hypothetical protein
MFNKSIIYFKKGIKNPLPLPPTFINWFEAYTRLRIIFYCQDIKRIKNKT